jgi:hypothetical protein
MSKSETTEKPKSFEETVELEKGKAKVEKKGFCDDGIDVRDISTFECSQRTKAIDYSATATTALKIFGPTFAVGWAVKFNLHGQKLKPGDYVKINGKEMSVEKFQEALATQKGWSDYAKSRSAGTQKISNKDLVTVGRMCRAFARSTIKMVQAGKDKPEQDIVDLAEDCDLPVHFAFLSSPYAMSDEEILENDEALTKFFKGFDDKIESAYKAKWVNGITKRSHLAEYRNLKEFRNIKQ